MTQSTATVTAFLGDERIAAGDRADVTRRIEDGYSAADQAAIRVFDDETGRPVDLDYWDAALEARHQRGRGRPRLGVVSREVTLLPRHWEWLARQRGGASAALRRLIDEAQAASGADPRARQDAAYHFMQAMGGDRPGYEEAIRALYRDDRAALRERTATWPPDIRQHVEHLLEGAATPSA